MAFVNYVKSSAYLKHLEENQRRYLQQYHSPYVPMGDRQPTTQEQTQEWIKQLQAIDAEYKSHVYTTHKKKKDPPKWWVGFKHWLFTKKVKEDATTR